MSHSSSQRSRRTGRRVDGLQLRSAGEPSRAASSHSCARFVAVTQLLLEAAAATGWGRSSLVVDQTHHTDGRRWYVVCRKGTDAKGADVEKPVDAKGAAVAKPPPLNRRCGCGCQVRSRCTTGFPSPAEPPGSDRADVLGGGRGGCAVCPDGAGQRSEGDAGRWRRITAASGGGGSPGSWSRGRHGDDRRVLCSPS